MNKKPDEETARNTADFPLEAAKEAARMIITPEKGGRVTENEWREILKRNNLRATEFCDLVHLKTGVVIHTKHIQTDFERAGELPRPMSALIRFVDYLFKVRNVEKI